MNIRNEESCSEQFAVISYSHSDTAQVNAELSVYDDNSVCYWYDNRMTGGKGYDTQFFDILDNKNCKGIIFFISDSFLLSIPCAKEMQYFFEKYGIGNPDKFCLFVLPKDYPYDNADAIYEHVDKYVFEQNDEEVRKKLRFLNEHIEIFLKLNRGGKEIYAVLGNVQNYAGVYCEDGQLFNNAGIIFGHKQITNEVFGYFPQSQTRKTGVPDIPENRAERYLDKKPAYYAPIEWLVIKDNEQSATFLSRGLLFAVDYLSIKYPFRNTDYSIGQHIKDNFLKYFRQEPSDKRTIKEIRFLSEPELKALLRRNQNNVKKKSEILLPEPTFFAQLSNRKNAVAFWLAGDMNDAKRVDAGVEGLSEEPVGVELYYIRIVIDVEKN